MAHEGHLSARAGVNRSSSRIRGGFRQASLRVLSGGHIPARLMSTCTSTGSTLKTQGRLLPQVPENILGSSLFSTILTNWPQRAAPSAQLSKPRALPGPPSQRYSLQTGSGKPYGSHTPFPFVKGCCCSLPDVLKTTVTQILSITICLRQEVNPAFGINLTQPEQISSLIY